MLQHMLGCQPARAHVSWLLLLLHRRHCEGTWGQGCPPLPRLPPLLLPLQGFPLARSKGLFCPSWLAGDKTHGPALWDVFLGSQNPSHSNPVPIHGIPTFTSQPVPIPWNASLHIPTCPYPMGCQLSHPNPMQIPWNASLHIPTLCKSHGMPASTSQPVPIPWDANFQIPILSLSHGMPALHPNPSCTPWDASLHIPACPFPIPSHPSPSCIP